MKSPCGFVRWEMKLCGFSLLAAALIGLPPVSIQGADAAPAADPLGWPEITSQCRPWAYWWWLGSAVDTTNLTRELERYHAAGMGGVHVIPIYGAIGWEQQYVEYLTPRWMDLLGHAVSEAGRLRMGVDMTTGSGWCFGGPNISDREANALVVAKVIDLPPGSVLLQKFDRAATQALVAFSDAGQSIELTDRLAADGSINWTAPAGVWRVYAVSQRSSGQKVKRAAPGGEGHMLNLIYPDAVTAYLRRFTDAFAAYAGPKPRAMYHDSYEYRSDWAPDFLARFAQRRGYRLETELDALFGTNENDRVARVKTDYRETVSDIMIEDSLPRWAEWARQHGFLTRDQAHGSPGNLLDLYAVADIPETEMFHKDRNRLVSKFASSAAHVAGRSLVAAETGTWLKEHFTETLADLKYLVDDLFLAGVNHAIYHGTCYSPDEAPWPGWLFYASTEMNPRNAIWRDVPALNAYITRCQAVLQAGFPDNDILLYWPIHDRWHNSKGRVQNFSVHARDWLEGESIGRAAQRLWNRGFAFDYVSDRQLGRAAALKRQVALPGGVYRLVAVPICVRMPLATLERLLDLARGGATVIFESSLPSDVPGLSDLANRRARLNQLLAQVKLAATASASVKAANLGEGRLLVGDLEAGLVLAGLKRETLVDHPGLFYLRRRAPGVRHYFLANRGDQTFDGWITLAVPGASAVILDPLSGRGGLAVHRQAREGGAQVQLRLGPGESLILRVFEGQQVTGPVWEFGRPTGAAVPLAGNWRVSFVQGGPVLPPPFTATELGSWTDLGGEEAARFAGTARYSLEFDAPAIAASGWILDLGRVGQSARVRLNGRDYGMLFTPPFRVRVDNLQLKSNRLEVEVTNLSANRIRDLDRRKLKWRTFRDINFVNIDYKPFDASGWGVADSGLLGPVTMQPLER